MIVLGTVGIRKLKSFGKFLLTVDATQNSNKTTRNS